MASRRRLGGSSIGSSRAHLPRGESSYDAHCGLVARVATGSDEHGEEEEDGRVRRDELLPRSQRRVGACGSGRARACMRVRAMWWRELTFLSKGESLSSSCSVILKLRNGR